MKHGLNQMFSTSSKNAIVNFFSCLNPFNYNSIHCENDTCGSNLFPLDAISLLQFFVDYFDQHLMRTFRRVSSWNIKLKFKRRFLNFSRMPVWNDLWSKEVWIQGSPSHDHIILTISMTTNIVANTNTPIKIHSKVASTTGKCNQNPSLMQIFATNPLVYLILFSYSLILVIFIIQLAKLSK